MWDVIKDWVFNVIQFFYNGVGDWGMAIIIITIIFRIIVAPLVHKSTTANFAMQKVQPLLQEMQRLYAETKFNPLAGCLPMLIQMPVFIALYQVLYSMVDRMPEGMTYQFYHLVPDLTKNPATAMGEGVLAFIPYLILMLIFAFVTFAPMLLQQKNSKDQNQKRQMLMMSGIMSLFMLWISWSAPAGVLLFWGASSIFAVIQQQLTMHFLKKKDAEEEAVAAVAPVKIDVTRKVKKPRPTKKR